MLKRLAVFCVLVGIAGCATSPVLQELNTFKPDVTITLQNVLKNPEAYKRKTVLWGGRILKVINKKDETIIEVLQLPLDEYGRPKNTDKSEGRFMILIDKYLDPAIYREGRKITVVGDIVGMKEGTIGEVLYNYPLIKAWKHHLWRIRPEGLDVYQRWPSYLYWGPHRSCGPYWRGWECW